MAEKCTKLSKTILKLENSMIIRPSIKEDIPFLVTLSYKKRRLYEKAQPQFWAYGGPQVEEIQRGWFEELLTKEDYVLLTACVYNTVKGFIIGHLCAAPEVYNPGGLTLIVDDFCVDQDTNWEEIGTQLIHDLKTRGKLKGAVQILVVCGIHDQAKANFLKSKQINPISQWYFGVL